MRDKNSEMARRIAEAVSARGGRAYFVGGLVRDESLGRESKDVDIEVHGIAPDALEALLGTLGQPVAMGASFGVYGLRHYSLDISIPRDADGKYAPCAGTMQAARRRDFTINSLMQDVLTGEILDPFGGLEDLRRGIIRHICDDTFVSDPLRVLRAAQFAARFGFTIAPETVALCAQLDLRGIAGERIFAELEKALLKAPRPSLFFQALRGMNQLEVWFPEVAALIGVPQEPRFHPEGDVWNHTMLVLDQAARLRSEAEYPLGLMLGALCHDFGKAEAIQFMDGRIRALGHEEAGLPLTDRFLKRMTLDSRLHRYTANLVALHMRPNLLEGQNAGSKSYNRLFDKAVSPADLLLLAKADALGCGACKDYSAAESALQGHLADFRALMAKPCVTGADLTALGFPPGPDLGKALAYAHKLHLAGVEKEPALRQTVGYLKRGCRE